MSNRNRPVDVIFAILFCAQSTLAAVSRLDAGTVGKWGISPGLRAGVNNDLQGPFKAQIVGPAIGAYLQPEVAPEPLPGQEVIVKALAFSDIDMMTRDARSELDEAVGENVVGQAANMRFLIEQQMRLDDTKSAELLAQQRLHALDPARPAQDLLGRLNALFDGDALSGGAIVRVEPPVEAAASATSGRGKLPIELTTAIDRFKASPHRIAEYLAALHVYSEFYEGSAPDVLKVQAMQRFSAALPKKLDPIHTGFFGQLFAIWSDSPEFRPMIIQGVAPFLDGFGAGFYKFRSDFPRLAEVTAFQNPTLRGELAGLFLKNLRLKKDDAVAASASRYMRGTKQSASIETYWRLTTAHDAQARQHLWTEIRRGAEENSSGRLSPKDLPSRWHEHRGPQLIEELPTLGAILSEPARLSGFLAALGALRAVAPYYLANDSELAPIEWGQKNGYVFAWNEMRIYPVSESFRRFIITNADGTYAIEMKIPGDMESRKWISPEHYTVAEWMEANGGASVKAVHDAYYTGSVVLYGRRRAFQYPFDPLGLVVFDYKDGKRRTNAVRLIDRIARQNGRNYVDLAREIDETAVAEAARLHQGGWYGTNGGGVDMHPENLRVHAADGSAALVADHGAFNRARSNWGKRTKETLDLIARMHWQRDPAQHVREESPTRSSPEYLLSLLDGALRHLVSTSRISARRWLRILNKELGIDAGSP